MRRGFTVGYRPTRHKYKANAAVITPMASVHEVEKVAHMSKRAAIRKEGTLYANLDERIPGFVMVNGELVRIKTKEIRGEL